MANFIILGAGLILSSLAFPSRSIWLGILGWVCFVPQIYLNEKNGTKTAFIFNFLFFCTLFSSLFWLNPFVASQRFADIKVMYIFLLLFAAYPLAYSALLILSKVTASKFDLYQRPFIYASLWVAFEYFLSILPFGFSLSFAVTQAGSPVLLQSVPIVGIFGISFLLILINAALALALIAHNSKLAFGALALFSVNFIYGSFVLNSSEIPKKLVKIALIQPNVTLEKSQYTGNPFFLNLSLDKLNELSLKSARQYKPGLIIWPELSADCYLLQSQSERLSRYANQIKTPLLVGTFFYDHEHHKPNNVAALINSSGSSIGIYKKRKLFPFFESQDCQAGEEVFPLTFDRNGLGRIGAMLCFESLYPQIAQELTNNGANLLVLLANGSWFGNSRWPYLHMSYIVFRAIENGRWAIHLNNTGPSVVVSHRGISSEIIPPAKTAVSIVKIEPRDNQTFYSRTHDLFPILITIFAHGLPFLPNSFQKGGAKTKE